MGEMKSARAAIEVVAGLIPGRDPDPEFTKRWFLTSDEWNEGGGRMTVLEAKNQEALAYAAKLMARPDRLNWVRVDWVWF